MRIPRLPILAGLLLVSGCSALRTLFPSRDEVFIPIPLEIGEARVVGTDTSYVVAEPSYELVAPRRELLPDAKLQIEAARREFRRFFGVEPVRVVVRLRDTSLPPAVADTALIPSDSAPVVTLPVLGLDERRQRAGIAPRIPLSRVARAWLRGYADWRTNGVQLRSAWGPSAAPRDDPRLPDWLEDGVAEMVASSPYQHLVLEQLSRQSGQLMPLRTLLSSGRLAGIDGDSIPAAPRRGTFSGGRELNPAQLFTAQSFALARFLAEREGDAFIGRLTDRLLAGESFATVVSSAREVPDDLDRLEDAWRRWLEQQGDR